MNSMKTTYIKMGLLLALLVSGFASTSYGSPVCAANWNDLNSHPDASAGCNAKDLKSQFSRIPSGGLAGTGWASGNILEFQLPGPKENFFVVVSGKRKTGQICCTKGTWSIKGYGAIRVIPNGVEVGGYKFLRNERRADVRSTPIYSGGVDGDFG